MNKPTKAMKKAERSRAKVARVIKQKGYPDGKLPAGKVLHHEKPVADGGKTTEKNTRVVAEAEHKKIHANRRKRGKI